MIRTLIMVGSILGTVTAEASTVCNLSSDPHRKMTDSSSYEADPAMGGRVIAEKTVEGLYKYKVVLGFAWKQGRIELTDLQTGAFSSTSFAPDAVGEGSISSQVGIGESFISLRCAY